MKRLLNTTRGRLTLLWLAMFAGALAVANAGIYLAVGLAAEDTVDRELRSQAMTVGSALRYDTNQVTYKGGGLPHESTSGVLIDMAVVGPWGVAQQTPDQPLRSTTLISLAAPVLRSREPVLVDFYDSGQVHRRAYVTAAPGGSAAAPFVVIASTSLTDLDASITRTMLVAALLSVVALLVSGALVHWPLGRVPNPVHQDPNLAD